MYTTMSIYIYIYTYTYVSGYSTMCIYIYMYIYYMYIHMNIHMYIGKQIYLDMYIYIYIICTQYTPKSQWNTFNYVRCGLCWEWCGLDLIFAWSWYLLLRVGQHPVDSPAKCVQVWRSTFHDLEYTPIHGMSLIFTYTWNIHLFFRTSMFFSCSDLHLHALAHHDHHGCG